MADNRGQGKIPQYSHRLMHRKRVTGELHDSYFRLMTIKHAIQRTAEETHSDDQLWGDIEWTIELLYNLGKTGSQLVWRPDQLETRGGRESQHPAEGALGTPDWTVWRLVQFGDQTHWWQDAVEKASIQQRVGPPGFRLSSPRERERHNADGNKSGSQYIAVLFGLQLPLTHNPFE